jgi:RsiW-degrading membrane proteinase PrsW (M82 family)
MVITVSWFLLMGTAALPVFLVYLWFRLSRIPLPLPWFFMSLFGGLLAVFAALVLQTLVPPGLFQGGKTVLPEIFFRIALTEELSRLLVLLPLFRLFRRFTGIFMKAPPDRDRTAAGSLTKGEYCATGLVCGLGFALIEGATYGASDIGVALLRAFTAAPLHGACGSRVGLAAAGFAARPLRGASRFFSAVIIHALYNFMILLPGISSALAVLAAFSFLLSSLFLIKRCYRREYEQ